MERDSFIFYKSFYEAIKGMPRDIQGEIYTAIMEYSLYGNEIENLKPIAKSVMVLIKPQLEANNKRYNNGKKGGAPVGNKNAKKQPKNNQKQPNDNVNDNVIKDINIKLISLVKPIDFTKPIYYFIAKSYHKLFLDINGETKTLIEAKAHKWIDDVRKLIEIDKVSIRSLIAIKYYFECSHKGERVDNFWTNTIKSPASLRKKNKEDVYYWDMITKPIKKWLSDNPNKELEIDRRLKNLNDLVEKHKDTNTDNLTNLKNKNN